MVARLVRDQEAMGSNPVTSTRNEGSLVSRNDKGTFVTCPFSSLLFASPSVVLVTG